MTSFDIVIDLALTTINDYKLKKLYNISRDGFQTYCDSFLIRAIPNFVRCKQPLTFDIESRSFEADLTQMEISILADLWVIEWFNKEIKREEVNLTDEERAELEDIKRKLGAT